MTRSEADGIGPLRAGDEAEAGAERMARGMDRYFARTCVINLASRPDRRAEMEAQLRRIGLSFDTPGVVLYEATKPAAPGGFPSVGARGCFVSHLDVLRAARAEGLRSILILEDDFNFCESFPARFGEAAGWLDGHDWGMFYGCYHLTEPLPPGDAPCVRVSAGMAVGTSAFVAVNGKHIAALVDYLEAMPRRPPGDPDGGPMHIDGAYCWFRRSHPEVATWLAQNPLGHQRSSKTDVHELRWYDRARWSAGVVASLRRLKNLALP